MVYVFEGSDGASVVYNAYNLNDEQKAQAIEVEALPIPEELPGKIAVLRANKEFGEVWYEYMDKPVDEKDVLEQRISDLELALAEMILI